MKANQSSALIAMIVMPPGPSSSPNWGSWTMSQFKALLCASLCVALGVSTSTHALDHHPWRTLRVPVDYPTIQDGINAAHEGDTVLVAPGTYTGGGNKNLNFRGKNLALVSGSGSTSSIIDCELHGRALYFGSGESAGALVRGFMIRGGSERFEDGGAIYCSASSPTLVDCTFQGNTARRGGALYCVNSASPSVFQCTIVDNSSDISGGGIYCADSSPTIVNCDISRNSTAGTGGAGGVSCEHGSAPTLTRCTITGNKSERFGGGLNCDDHSSPFIEDCLISGNTAGRSGAGGGVDCYWYSYPR